jgi:hypothetical protein
MRDRLRPSPGPLAGFPGLLVEVTPQDTSCGGIHVQVVRRGRTTVDRRVVAALTLAPVRGLDFAARPEESRRVFAHWLERFQTLLREALEAQAAIARDVTAPVRDRVQARAYGVELYRQAAIALAFMEVPADVRAGPNGADKVVAFCTAMAEQAAPLAEAAAATAAVCRDSAGKVGVGPGPWDDVCAEPAAAP